MKSKITILLHVDGIYVGRLTKYINYALSLKSGCEIEFFLTPDYSYKGIMLVFKEDLTSKISSMILNLDYGFVELKKSITELKNSNKIDKSELSHHFKIMNWNIEWDLKGVNSVHEIENLRLPLQENKYEILRKVIRSELLKSAFIALLIAGVLFGNETSWSDIGSENILNNATNGLFIFIAMSTINIILKLKQAKIFSFRNMGFKNFKRTIPTNK